MDLGDVIMDVKFKFEIFGDFDVMCVKIRPFPLTLHVGLTISAAYDSAQRMNVVSSSNCYRRLNSRQFSSHGVDRPVVVIILLFARFTKMHTGYI